MDIKKNFLTILKSINPYSYDELVDRRFSDAIKYLIFVLIVATTISLVLFVPKLFFMTEDIRLAYDNFDSASINAEYSFNQSFILIDDPIIRFDHNNSMGDETALITDDSLYYRKFLLFGPVTSIQINKIVDLKSGDSLTKNLVLFLLPSLFFWGFILFTIYFVLVILLMILFGLIFLWIARINIKILRVIKIAMYSSTIFICLQLIILPFYRMIYVPVIAYVIIFILVLFVYKEEESVQGSGKNNFSKKNIFSDEGRKESFYIKKKSSQFKNSDNQMNFDVDDNGNLKKSSFKKKSFEEENDGYVMLK